MKTTSKRIEQSKVLMALCSALLALPAYAATAPVREPPVDGPVQVHFLDPDDFTDATFDNRDSSRAEVTQELAAWLAKRATPLLAPGQRLEVDVTDIDLAGRYEPWTSFGHDIRYLRDITWPRMKLSYRLLDAQGAQVAGASEDLSDMNYLMRIGVRSDTDRLRYEKAMIDDWVQMRFGSKKKG